jgi:hypothetical protein
MFENVMTATNGNTVASFRTRLPPRGSFTRYRANAYTGKIKKESFSLVEYL